MNRLLRALLRDPRTSIPALLLLAIGVGGFAWMLALRRSLLLRSLPVPDPARLVALYNGSVERPDSHGTPSVGELMLFREEGDLFEGVAATDRREVNLGGDAPRYIRMERVTTNAFRVFGVQPALGRDFAGEEEEPGRDRVVLVSHAFWTSTLGADPSALGRPLDLDGVPHQIIGVLPKGFHTPRGSEVFKPLPLSARARTDFGAHFLSVFARLRPGVTLTQVQARMRALPPKVGRQVPELTGEDLQRLTYGASPLIEEWLGSGLKVLRALTAASFLLLVLAALNASALLVARAAARRRELAVRSALGATPWELRRLLLAEGAVLGFCGALLGLALAALALGPAGQALRWGQPDLPLDGLGLDGGAVALTLALGPLVGMVCALVALPGRDLVPALREGGRGQVGGSRPLRQRLALGQLALAGALLGVVAWLHGGVNGLLALDPGFQPKGVWTFRLSPTSDLLRDPARLDAVQRDVRAALLQVPGVREVGAFNNVPMTGLRSDLNIHAQGSDRIQDPQARSASPGALKVLGHRFQRGRDFTEADGPQGERVVILTANLARACFGEADPIGRQVVIDGPATVVGVIADFREFGPGLPAPPVFFLPYAQGQVLWNRTLHLALRYEGPAPSLQSLQAVVQRSAPGLSVHHAQSLEANLDEVLGPQRMARAFLACFAVLALLLATGGVYALMAASVAQREGEFGLRAALGATARDLLALVLHEAGRLTLVGGLLGLALGLALRHGGSAWVGELAPTGALPAAASFAGLALASLLASLPAAWRASRVDPAVALRAE
ncbi:MAG TPA: ABC transporter permease [Holophagaceae bacterium]|nr:ABC transporter permease [Holophagaceae bacterium]